MGQVSLPQSPTHPAVMRRVQAMQSQIADRAVRTQFVKVALHQWVQMQELK